MCGENIPGLLLSTSFGQELKNVLSSRSSLTVPVEGFAPAEPVVTWALMSLIMSRMAFLMGLGLLTLLVTSGENPSGSGRFIFVLTVDSENERFWPEDTSVFDGFDELDLVVSWAGVRVLESDFGLETRVTRK